MKNNNMSRPRKYIIGGNWKCNGLMKSTMSLLEETINKSDFDDTRVDVIVAPISMHLGLVKALINKKVKIACQNMNYQGKGAFTGETSAQQLRDFEIEWVIIGHSERRKIFGETNELVAKKIASAQAAGLKAIVCLGESLEQREAGQTNDHLMAQLEAIKDSVKNWDDIVLAYEPIWAIGTGRTATPGMAEVTHQYIRSWLHDNISPEVAEKTRIQYGGSVNAGNAAALILQPNIDGFLVGGASLKPDFKEIIRAANEHHAKPATEHANSVRTSNDSLLEGPGGLIVVQASSGGFGAGNFAEIAVNGEKVKLLPNSSGHERGLHLVIIDQRLGQVVGGQVFDTYQSSAELDEFIEDGIPEGAIVVAACKDDFEKELSVFSRGFFSKMGSAEILNVEYRHGFVFIGVQGAFNANEKRAIKATDNVSVAQVFTYKDKCTDQDKVWIQKWLNYTGDDVAKKIDNVIDQFGTKKTDPQAPDFGKFADYNSEYDYGKK